MTRALITGSVGFVAGNFLRYALANTDWHFVGLDRLDTAASLESYIPLFEHYPTRFESVWHDLRAEINPTNHPKLGGHFDYVVHFAAGSHVDRSVRDPIGFLEDNVLGTAYLLDFLRWQKLPQKILYFSTDEVFGPAEPGVTFDEYSAHTPNNPYSASKAAAEAIIPAWANTYGLPLVVSHCTNVYGPRQHSEKFIPLATKLIRDGSVVQIHARNGVPSSRYYVHVDDVSRAVLTILDRGGIWGGPRTGKYNISGAEELSNLDVAERIAKLLGKKLHIELVDFVPNRPRHDMAYRVDSTRLEALGWAPQVAFDDGLKELVKP